ncbi:MAG: WavE lipopolysaccharide synthesis family protein [Clostridia bacterium]|nr:WavE lipopolysaccharide synthesis family protein [Clostridia bacterium]
MKLENNYGILIQGPVYPVTVSIIKHFCNLYGSNSVIVSTWKDSEPCFLEAINTLTENLVLNTLPEFPGKANRNAQIASTISGIKKAKEIGMEYLAKIRSDLLIEDKYFMQKCHSLLETYSDGQYKDFKLRKRLIVPNIYTRKYLFYHPSDWFMFGHIDDLYTYWDLPMDLRKLNFTIRGLAEDASKTACFPEIYFCKEFCKKIGWNTTDTFEDSLSLFKNIFIVFDHQFFRFNFAKGPILEKYYGSMECYEVLNFSYWLGLYHDLIDLREEAYEFKQKNYISDILIST